MPTTFALAALLSSVAPASAVDYAAFRAQLAVESGWSEIDRKNVSDVGEIVVRHKQILQQDCLEATAYAPFTADDLLAISTDINSQDEWSSWAIKRSAKLTSGATSFDYYQLLDNPSPIADRYWFLRGTVARKGEDRVFMWEGIDPTTTYAAQIADITANFPGAVVTAVNVGDWTFTPSGANSRIRYRICTDAGGSIPSWAGQFAARTTLPTNLSDLIHEARRRLSR